MPVPSANATADAPDKILSWETSSFATVRLLGTETGRAVFVMTVTPDLCNGLGTLHGGCAATLLDIMTSMSVATLPPGGKIGSLKPGETNPGAPLPPEDDKTPSVNGILSVTRTLNLTYLRASRAGETLVCDTAVMGMGRRALAVEGRLLGRAGGKSKAAGAKEVGGGPDTDDIVAAALGGPAETRVTCVHDKAVIANML